MDWYVVSYLLSLKLIISFYGFMNWTSILLLYITELKFGYTEHNLTLRGQYLNANSGNKNIPLLIEI